MTFWTGTTVRFATVEFANFTDDGDIRCGELFAVRWAFDDRQTWSVLVFEVGSTPVLVEEF